MLIGIDASRAALARRTGTENYSLQLIRHLVSLDQRHRYRLYFNRPPALGLFDPRSHVELRVIPLPRLWTHVRLSLEMLQRPPDLLFVPAHVLPLIRPRRTVVTVHDLGYRYHPEAHRLFDRLYLEWTTRWHVRAATHVLADSEATGRDLIEVYGANPARVTVVYPGCDPVFRPALKSQVAAVRRRYGISGDYVLHVGTLQPRKNLELLLAAFAALKSRGTSHRSQVSSYKSQVTSRQSQVTGTCDLGLATWDLRPETWDLRLVLAGKKGWLFEGLFRRVRELGLENQVIFPGFVPDEDLPALMTGARVLAMPSLYEGFGLPVVEAMACGTPVVCSNRSSLPEVTGEAALLVDPLDVGAWAEALEKVLWDEELRTELRERGFRQAQKFTWEEAARRTLEVFERVI